MSDHENSGFKVVDRRHAVAETVAAEGAAPVGAEDQTASSDPIPEIDEQSPPNDEPQSAAAAAAIDDEAAGNGMPDPSLLLSIAAMQLNVQTLARLLVPIFDGQAWRSMGFLADPRTGETQQDLPAAQLAIDCVQFLLSKIDAGLPDTERREMQRRLNDLRMNYLSKLRGG
jgi:hypothetical protein